MRSQNNWITYLKNKYKPNTRIKLIQMNNDLKPVEPNTLGTVQFVDDIGNIQMKWDNGSELALIPNVDEFEVI